MPHLLLAARMAVIPVGAALPNRELIDEGLTRADAGKAHAWHTVHREWHEKAVPMDRAVLVELVGDRQPDILPLLEAEPRRGHGAVDADRVRRQLGRAHACTTVTTAHLVCR